MPNPAYEYYRNNYKATSCPEKEHPDLQLCIQRYEQMIDRRLNEASWQSFFDEHPILLQFAFNYPVSIVQSQASVGGRGLSRTGDRIADFVVKHARSNNAAIIEIKTPQAKLLNCSAYRNGVFPPSSELTGAVCQVLDQKRTFQARSAQIKCDSRIYDIEDYSVHCYLIIGMMPEGHDKNKSFEMFRAGLRDVQIITFDEILYKLKLIYDVLCSARTITSPCPPVSWRCGQARLHPAHLPSHSAHEGQTAQYLEVTPIFPRPSAYSRPHVVELGTTMLRPTP